jgi:hypothetical protein
MELDHIGIGMEPPRGICSDGTRRQERWSGTNETREEVVRVLLVTGIRPGGNPEGAALGDRLEQEEPATKESENSCMGHNVLAFLGSIHG